MQLLAFIHFLLPSSRQEYITNSKSSNEERIEALVSRRIELRRARDYTAADAILTELISMGVKIQDTSDGSTDWRILPKDPDPLPDILTAAKKIREHACLATTEKEYQDMLKETLDLVYTVLNSPNFQPSFHLPGRRAADTAFHLAMAGCEDEAIYNALADCVASELEKCPEKLSTLQAVERLAAANINTTHPVFDCPSPKCNTRDFFHPRAQLWRFRYSTSKQARERRQNQEYDDAEMTLRALLQKRRPLIIDLGAGMGASALGFAKSFPDYQVLALEPLASCVRQARAMARRLGLEENCVFLREEADHVLPIIQRLHFPCALILCQFPTPFVFHSSSDLESSSSSDDEQNKDPTTLIIRGGNTTRFLLSEKVLDLVPSLLNYPFHFQDGTTAQNGALYFSSNVEDVAVAILNLLNTNPHLSPLILDSYVEKESLSSPQPKSPNRRRIPLREQRWTELAPPDKRARGRPWLSSSPFPKNTATETEAMLLVNHQPVHRLLFSSSS